jgi:hypothetical protein
MPLCPFAQFMPVTSRALEPFKQDPIGLILHISNSRGNTLDGLRSTFMGDNKFPSHFGVDRAGNIGQFLDTRYHDWAEENTIAYFSVENSANPGDQLSGAQIQGVARIYGWLSRVHAIAIKIAVAAGDTGLAYHSLFMPTPHVLCPGPAVLGQRHKIIEATKFMFVPVGANP